MKIRLKECVKGDLFKFTTDGLTYKLEYDPEPAFGEKIKIIYTDRDKRVFAKNVPLGKFVFAQSGW